MDKKHQEFYKEKDKKLRWDLVPWNTFEKVVEVITKGAKKYGIDNWKTVNSNVFEAAMLRHFISYKKGERYDSQWNLTHLAHFTCNAIFLLWKELLVIEIEKSNYFTKHYKDKVNANSILGKLNLKEERGELKSNEASEKNKNGGKK